MMVVDSDVLIDSLRGRQMARDRVSAAIRAGSLVTTSINSFELLSGAKTENQLKKVEALLTTATILPFSQGAARIAASIRKELEAEGKTIGTADYLIAGICLERSAPLLTRNVAHFGRVPGLLLEAL